MRGGGLVAAITLLAISCSGGSSPAASPDSSPSSSASPSGSPADQSYGLLLSAGTLQMITTSGTVAASMKVSAPSAHTCGQGHSALLQPPVSATDNAVFYRDGNTTIRYFGPDGKRWDATTVPGGASTISFFSVGPQGIAVLVEDFSPADRINLTLYVEDLGPAHRNHRVIYTNSTPKSESGTTLWPMGWYRGLLVLAVFPVCNFGSAGQAPIEWHVSNPTTAIRVATIGKNGCIPSYWPSRAGVMCLDLKVDRGDGFGIAYVYDWLGKISATRLAQKDLDFQSGLSPLGSRYFKTPRLGIGAPPPSTQIVSVATGSGPPLVAGHAACLWIDEDHLLAPDAVIRVQSATQPAPPTGNVSATATPRQEVVVTASVTALAAGGVCAGRFPGGL